MTAACVSIQIRLDKALLWFACRHHVGEIILTHVWEALKIETSSGPEIKLFVRFRDNFTRLSKTNTDYNFPEFTSDISDIADQISSFLATQECYRGDYKELLTLSLAMLTKDTDSLHLQAPGALHRARWMAKLLYSMKMVMLSDKIGNELPRGAVFASGQIQKLERFVKFVLLVYVPWWISCTSAADAPVNDLMLVHKLQSYEDEVIGKAALKAFSNHMWYLSEELVPLALFSTGLSASQKNEIVKKLKNHKTDSAKFRKRTGAGFGKPFFPKDVLQSTTLADLVGPDSWGFFQTLKMDTTFLDEHSAGEWSEDAHYQAAKEIVRHLRVANDSAERGVKLSK